MRKNMNYIDNKLEQFKDEYYENVAGLAESVYQSVIVTVCKKYHLDFHSGMGTWAFFGKGFNAHRVDDLNGWQFEEHLEKEKIKSPDEAKAELTHAIDLLSSSAIDGSSIGTYIGRSYKYQKTTKEHIEYIDKIVK